MEDGPYLPTPPLTPNSGQDLSCPSPVRMDKCPTVHSSSSSSSSTVCYNPRKALLSSALINGSIVAYMAKPASSIISPILGTSPTSGTVSRDTSGGSPISGSRGIMGTAKRKFDFAHLADSATRPDDPLEDYPEEDIDEPEDEENHHHHHHNHHHHHHNHHHHQQSSNHQQSTHHQQQQHQQQQHPQPILGSNRSLGMDNPSSLNLGPTMARYGSFYSSLYNSGYLSIYPASLGGSATSHSSSLSATTIHGTGSTGSTGSTILPSFLSSANTTPTTASNPATTGTTTATNTSTSSNTLATGQPMSSGYVSYTHTYILILIYIHIYACLYGQVCIFYCFLGFLFDP